MQCSLIKPLRVKLKLVFPKSPHIMCKMYARKSVITIIYIQWKPNISSWSFQPWNNLIYTRYERGNDIRDDMKGFCDLVLPLQLK